MMLFKKGANMQKKQLISSLRKTVSMFVSMLPILAGVILLTGLALEFLPTDKVAEWFDRNNLMDALIGATFGCGCRAPSYQLRPGR